MAAVSQVGSARVAVAATPTLLAQAPHTAAAGPVMAVWLLPDTAVDVDLGGPTVKTGKGLPLVHNATPALFGPITLFSGDTLYAVTPSGSATISVLQT